MPLTLEEAIKIRSLPFEERIKHPDFARAQSKIWYENNKNEKWYKDYNNAKSKKLYNMELECTCGQMIKRGNKAGHLKTKKHKRQLTEKENTIVCTFINDGFEGEDFF